MTLSRHNTSFQLHGDRWLTRFTRLCAGVSAAIVLLVFLFLLKESWPAFRKIGVVRFFTDESWHPLSQRFSLLPMMVATALTTSGAVLLATPLGILSAVFGCYYAPCFIAAWHRRLIELLAGIPSVVFGLWGLVVLVPLLTPLGGSGQSLLSGTLVLALMILPTIALTAQSALAAVPKNLIRGAAALGLRPWAIAWQISIPQASRGIKTGLVLAATRAIGETMAVLMLAGNVAEMPDSVVSPVRTLTANIALEMGYATAEHRSILFVSGMFLMLAVLAGVLVSELMEAHGNE